MLRKATKRYVSNKLSRLSTFHRTAMLRKASFRKLRQALHAVFEWKTRRTRCRSRPVAIRVESSAICNLKCPLCSTTYRRLRVGQPRHMSLDLYKSIHEKVKD